MSLFTAARFKTLGVQRLFTVLFLFILIAAQPGFNQPVVKAAPGSSSQSTFHENFSSNAYKGSAQNAKWDIWNQSLGISLTDGIIHDKPVSAIDQSGYAYTAWMDYRSDGNAQIYMQKVDSAGNRVWKSDLLIEAVPDDTNLAIASDDEAYIYLAWSHLKFLQGIPHEDILIQKIDSSGNILFPTGGKIALKDAWFSGNPWSGSDCYKLVFAGGFLYFAWFANYNDLHLQKVNTNGDPVWGNDLLVYQNTNPIKDQGPSPFGITASQNRLMVVWDEYLDPNLRPYYMPSSIFAQSYSVDGNPQWAKPVLVNTGPNEGELRVALDGAGNCVITWDDDANFVPDSHHDDEDGVYAQKLDASGKLIWKPGGIQLTGPNLYNLQLTFTAGYFFVLFDEWQGVSSPIHVTMIDGNGTEKWSTNVKLNDTLSAQMNFSPSMVIAKSGSPVYIFWSNKQILGEALTIDGSHTWASDTPINDLSGDSDQYHVSMAADHASGAFVSWLDDRDNQPVIYLQRVDSSGHRLWDADLMVSSMEISRYVHPALTVDNSNNVTVFWYQNESELVAQRFDSNGNRIWQTDLDIHQAVETGVPPATATDKDGNIILAVISPAPNDFSGQLHVYVMKIDPSGKNLWPDFVTANVPGPDYPFVASLITDSDGNAYVAWDHAVWDPVLGPSAPEGISVQNISPAGVKLWDDSAGFTVDGFAYTYSSDQIQLALNQSGQLDVVASLFPQNSQSKGLLMQKLDLSGKPVWPTNHEFTDPDNNSWISSFISIIPSKDGDLTLIFDKGNYGHYARKIDQEGSSVWPDDIHIAPVQILYPGYDGSAAMLDNGKILTLLTDKVGTWNSINSDASLLFQTLDTNGNLGLPAGTRFIDPEHFFLSSGQAVSAKVNPASGNVLSAILTADFETNGGSLAFSLSNDGGKDWTLATPGIKTTFTTPGADLRWKVDLQEDPSWPRSPAITGVTIDYTTVTSGGDLYEPDDTCAEARPIEVTGAQQAHNFDAPSDEDWAWFDARAGYSYTLTVTGAR